MAQPAFAAPFVDRQRAAAPPLDHIGILREMLGDIGTTTRAGQVYLMGKIVSELETELAGRGRTLTELDRRRARRQLDDLGKQAARLAPAPGLFVEGAELAIALLDARQRLA